jgi:hypothetical protein
LREIQDGKLHKKLPQKIVETGYFAEKPALAFVSARPIFVQIAQNRTFLSNKCEKSPQNGVISQLFAFLLAISVKS